MPNWTSAELDKFGKAEEMELESMRGDGTMRDPVTIWVVRLGDELYVRSVRGPTAGWFRGTQVRHEGRIRAGGAARDVTFANADPGLNDRVDAAYRAKYRSYAANIINSVLTPTARSTTMTLVPRA